MLDRTAPTSQTVSNCPSIVHVLTVAVANSDAAADAVPDNRGFKFWCALEDEEEESTT